METLHKCKKYDNSLIVNWLVIQYQRIHTGEKVNGYKEYKHILKLKSVLHIREGTREYILFTIFMNINKQ